MYEIKKSIYLDFTKNQKAGLCSYLRAMVKKFPNLSCDKIYQKFVDDEKYYLEMNCSRFEFLQDILYEDWFEKDTKKYLNECIKYYQYKEKQRPIIEANKAYEKQKREFLRRVKMSKTPPTKKQIYYYEKLCKKYSRWDRIHLKNITLKKPNSHQNLMRWKKLIVLFNSILLITKSQITENKIC